MMNITRQLLASHLVAGTLTRGERIAIRIDQSLTQDASGTMVYLQFEALDLPRVKVPLAVSYVDHNTNQLDFKNPDDHEFLRTVAARYGIHFSKPGNGICHQVNLERFGKPGSTGLGSDSHTPTAGGLGMFAMGAGGLDVALAMAGEAFTLTMPGVVRVHLTGALPPWVTAKDLILEILRRESVKGGVGWVYEYGGEGVHTLSIPERATITNMGAELGATTSIFPSDEVTRCFLRAQGREADWREVTAGKNATYDREIHFDLRTLEPLAACPNMPDQGRPLRDLQAEGVRVQQVVIGSCTNSSYTDLTTAARILKGKKVHPDCALAIAPGSRQVLSMIAENGSLQALIAAGARVLEATCGPCVGMSFAPASQSVSFRTINRNFQGRCGTHDAQVYLVSPEAAALAALEGRAVDPRGYGAPPVVDVPEYYWIDDSMILPPPEDGSSVEVIRGPNIKALPQGPPLASKLNSTVLLTVGDHITTDDIMPAGKYLALRSNVPEYAKHVFEGIDPTFHKRALAAKAAGGGIIVAGDNYGQGSAREHAALCPMYLGIKVVLAKSFARIHLANLINFGIVPLTFENPIDATHLSRGDHVQLDCTGLEDHALVLHNTTQSCDIAVRHSLSADELAIIRAGGKLAYVKARMHAGA